jgi:hypothetical protein
MEQQHTRAWFRGGEISSFQNYAVGRFKVDNAWRIAGCVANKQERD